jgi:hypothetical protein
MVKKNSFTINRERRMSLMSKLTMKKVSQLLVAVLLISALMPVIAFGASGFKNVTYDGQNVSGTVYSDTYSADGVTVSIYSPDGTLIAVVPTVYLPSSEYEWSIQSVPVDTYGFVTLKAPSVNADVYTAVYDNTAPTWAAGPMTASNITASSVDLNWPKATDNKTSVTYHVYQGNTLKSDSVTGQTYSITGLAANTMYTFKVEAVDAFGNKSTPQTLLVNTRTQSGGVIGGGWGGGSSGNSTNSDGSINVTNGQVDASTLKSAFANKTEVTLVVKGETVTIPVSALLDAAKNSDATLVIKTDSGTYVLPLSVFDFDALAKELGISVNDLKFTVNVKKLTGSDATAVSDAVTAAGGKALADAVDFSITFEGKDGKKTSITSFNQYVKRIIKLNSKPSKNAVVLLYDPATKTFSFVPGSISDTEAEFWRTGNSIYTVVESSKTFSDIATHWAKADIELLASKMIVNGATDTTFEAERNITRAEFAALVVRSLGLTPAASAAKFSDIKSADWFAGAVGAAVQAGIVNGYEDGSFRPQAQINREEMAAMVVRAYEFADGKVAVDQTTISKAFSKYSDTNKIVWAQREVALALYVGLMDGLTDTTLETDEQATRAQSATMLKRFLSKVEFID